MNNSEKEITDKQAAFLEALLGEARGNIRAAMDIAGYSKMTKTSEVVSSLREEITDRVGLMLAMNAPKAAFGIVEVLDDASAMGARNAISAARENLARIYHEDERTNGQEIAQTKQAHGKEALADQAKDLPSTGRQRWQGSGRRWQGRGVPHAELEPHQIGVSHIEGSQSWCT